MKGLNNFTKQYFSKYKNIYKKFLIFSIIYFLLAFLLFSRTQDLPFDMILAMVYGAYAAPILGLILMHKTFYQSKYGDLLEKTELFAILVSPAILTYIIFMLFALVRFPSQINIFDLHDFQYSLVYLIISLVINVTLSYIYLGIIKFNQSSKQLVWKISMIIIWLVLFFVIDEVFNISIYVRSEYSMIYGTIFSIYLIIEMIMTYKKIYIN